MLLRDTAVLVTSLLLLFVSALPCAGQTQPAAGPNATVLKAGVSIVVVDVVVEDTAGTPVHGLQSQNFKLTESNEPQAIGHFEEHASNSASGALPSLGTMPAGTFTNYTPVPPDGSLTVLLLDSLNTAMMDQAYMRAQLQKYARQAQPGAQIAIFGLTDRLLMLQGFTGDPAVLRAAVDHKLIPCASTALAGGGGVGEMGFQEALNTAAGGVTVANVATFDAPMAQYDASARLQDTIAAFHTLARYLAAFPGRKNVIWFSGSFPTSIFLSQGHLELAGGNSGDFRETADLLARARVAVYPVNAHGLAVDPMLNAANTPNVTGTSRQIAAQSVQLSNAEAIDHSSMEQVAADTGGHAFYNTNGIVQAVDEVVTAGANYYTLMYKPANSEHKPGFRAIHVQLIDAPKGLKLAYRDGYYPIPPKSQTEDTDTSDAAAFAAMSGSTHARYDRAAMAHGAPTPEDLVFKVRLLPGGMPAETKLAPLNVLDPAHPLPGPFHRYAVDFALLPSEITFQTQPDGAHKAELMFTVFLYDHDGKLLVAAHRGFKLKNLNADIYKQLLAAVFQCHMEISVPECMETFVRAGVQDVSSDRFGAVEIPVAAVANLPPPVYGHSSAQPTASAAKPTAP